MKNINYPKRQIHIIYSPANDRRQLKLGPPIPISYPHNVGNLEVFLDKFIAAIDECHSPLVGYWFRVLQAFEGDPENSALVLTIAIEGLLKNYYKSIQAPNEKFLRQLNNAKPLVKALEVEKPVKDFLMSAMGNAKGISPKNALYKLAESGLISKNMVEVWKELRNKSTHADELKFEAQELQAFIDDRYVCLELFYRLIFAKINYSGEITQYSVIGWPESNLSPPACLQNQCQSKGKDSD